MASCNHFFSVDFLLVQISFSLAIFRQWTLRIDLFVLFLFFHVIPIRLLSDLLVSLVTKKTLRLPNFPPCLYLLAIQLCLWSLSLCCPPGKDFRRSAFPSSSRRSLVRFPHVRFPVGRWRSKRTDLSCIMPCFFFKSFSDIFSSWKINDVGDYPAGIITRRYVNEWCLQTLHVHGNGDKKVKIKYFEILITANVILRREYPYMFQ